MDKEASVHICNGMLLSHKKEGNDAICSNKDAARDDHAEKVSQKETNTIRHHSHADSKIQTMAQTNLATRQK